MATQQMPNGKEKSSEMVKTAAEGAGLGLGAFGAATTLATTQAATTTTFAGATFVKTVAVVKGPALAAAIVSAGPVAVAVGGAIGFVALIKLIDKLTE
jgi:hypothetical protein